MRKRFSLLIVAGLMLAGCETGPKPYHHAGPLPPPPPPPPRSEFAWSVGAGANGLQGEAVWRRGGRSFSCAGRSVALTPETPYTRKRMLDLYGSDEQAIRSVAEVRARSSEPARDYRAYVRTTQCDAQGRFAFHGLPDGGWFVIVRGDSAGGASQVALKRVRLAGGEQRSVHIAG